MAASQLARTRSISPDSRRGRRITSLYRAMDSSSFSFSADRLTSAESTLALVPIAAPSDSVRLPSAITS